MLVGYRTYIIALLLGVAKTAEFLGYIDDKTFNAVATFLGAGGLFTLRAAISNLPASIPSPSAMDMKSPTSAPPSSDSSSKLPMIVFLLLFLGVSSTFAAGPTPPFVNPEPGVNTSLSKRFHLETPTAIESSDIQLYVRQKNSPGRMATGISYGPLYKIYNGGYEIGSLFSVCGFVSTTTSGSSDFSGGIGVCPFRIFGLDTSITYDPVHGTPAFGIGLSFNRAFNQLTK